MPSRQLHSQRLRCGTRWARSGRSGAAREPTSFRNTSLLFLASSLEVSASAVLGFLEAWNEEEARGWARGQRDARGPCPPLTAQPRWRGLWLSQSRVLPVTDLGPRPTLSATAPDTPDPRQRKRALNRPHACRFHTRPLPSCPPPSPITPPLSGSRRKPHAPSWGSHRTSGFPGPSQPRAPGWPRLPGCPTWAGPTESAWKGRGGLLSRHQSVRHRAHTRTGRGTQDTGCGHCLRRPRCGARGVS